MTPDQRFERVQHSSQPLVSAQIKGSVQSWGQGGGSIQPNHLRPLLTNAKDGGDSKFDNQTSKVSKDSLIYSAGDDERQTAHQKSTLSGTSDEQLNSQLVSDQQTFLRNPAGEFGLGGSQNIQIQDFSKNQDLGKLIINETVPRGEVLTSTFNQAGSLKKSSKRVLASETTQIFLSPDTRSGADLSKDFMRSSPVQITQIREAATQNRDQTILRHEVLSQQTGTTQYLHPNPESSIPRVQESASTYRNQTHAQPIAARAPERNVPTLPLTASPQMQSSGLTLKMENTTTSYTGQPQSGENPNRTITQHQGPGQSTGTMKPTASSLLATKSTPSQQPARTGADRDSSNSSMKHGPSHAVATEPAVTNPHRTNQGQPVLALRTSHSTAGGQTQVIKRTLAATPDVLEYVRMHQGKLPQDSVINHPPKVVAEYTLDADGNRVEFGAHESQLSERKFEHQGRVQRLPADPKPRVSETKLVEGSGVPVQPEPIMQQTGTARTFGEERVHQIEEEVIIENKPYIIDPKTGTKIYVDPNNLSAYVSLFKGKQDAQRTQPGPAVPDAKPRGVLRPSSHAAKSASGPTDPAVLRLGPHTQVVQVPRSSQPGQHQTLAPASKLVVPGVPAPATRAPPQESEQHSAQQPSRSKSKRAKSREASAKDCEETLGDVSQRSRHKKSKHDRGNVVRIPMDQAEEFLAQHRRKNGEVPRIDIFRSKGPVSPDSRLADEQQGTIRIVPGITKAGEGYSSESHRHEGKSLGSKHSRDPAVIKVHAAKTYEYGSTRPNVGYSEYSTSAYQTASASTSWQPSTALFTSSRQLETPSQQYTPLPLVVSANPGLQPTAFTGGLSVPQLHTLPGLDMRADIDSTLQRIINRAFI